MPLENWIQHSGVDQFLYDWQTVIAGVLAFAAGFGTVVAAIWAIWATRSTAREQIDASHEEADRVIAATRDQTAVARKQIDETLRLERRRIAREGYAFHAMLAAAMKRVLAEADEAREFVTGSKPTDGPSEEAYKARTNFSKLAFMELRAACVRYGGPLTEKFLELEIKIDRCRSKAEQVSDLRRVGVNVGLLDELAKIEAKATNLRGEAVSGMDRANIVFAETEPSEQ